MLTGRVTLEVNVDRNTTIQSSASAGTSSNVIGVHRGKTHITEACLDQLGNSWRGKWDFNSRIVGSLLIHKCHVVATGCRSGGSNGRVVVVCKKISSVVGTGCIGRGRSCAGRLRHTGSGSCSLGNDCSLRQNIADFDADRGGSCGGDSDDGSSIVGDGLGNDTNSFREGGVGSVQNHVQVDFLRSRQGSDQVGRQSGKGIG